MTHKEGIGDGPSTRIKRGVRWTKDTGHGRSLDEEEQEAKVIYVGLF